MDAPVFFRADDIGWDHGRFERLAGLFAARGLKLNAAAIPLACERVAAALDLGGLAGCLEVHSHGLAHLDHESAGKKSEFGDSRGEGEVARDLVRSRETGERLFGGLYYPAFVPPWNRLAERFLPLLPAAGFRALSRDGRPRAAVPGLAEHNVAVDLHTSPAPPESPAAALTLLEARSAAGAAVGVMLHHARMAGGDFAFLAALLDLLRGRAVRPLFLSELEGPWA